MKNHISKFGIFAILSVLIFGSCEDYTENFPVPKASIVAEFTFEGQNQVEFPVTVTFTNLSIIPERVNSFSYLWDFGDGETSTEDNPVHTYTVSGKYQVILTITTDSESVDKQKNVIVGALFQEDFNGISVFPEDWVLINVDGNTPDDPSYASLTDSAWIIVNSSFFESNAAFGISFYSPEAAADDWMITPKISLGENSVLTWQAISLTTSGNYPDSYEVYVSTTTQDIPGCTANGVILSVIDESWRIDASVPGEGIASHEVDLSDFAGQDVYIAFRLMTPYPGGDRIVIDNIKVVNL